MLERNCFKSGFVNIIGCPNVGKSTLLNALMGEKLAITSSKAQTTRRRVLGILSGEGYQIVFSDTPGVIRPAYRLQEKMMGYLRLALEDADIILLMVSLGDKNVHSGVIDMVMSASVPVIFLINKMDLQKGSQVHDKTLYWQGLYPGLEIMAISALARENISLLLERIIELLPYHAPYYPGDALTDKSVRFICAEIIREQIFVSFRQEIPYSAEVVVTHYKEQGDRVWIGAEIFVERESQRGILIGKKGGSIKALSTRARREMAFFLGKSVHLEAFVKVAKDWRRDDRKLRRFGYE